jgi:hypothetical protein
MRALFAIFPPLFALLFVVGLMIPSTLPLATRLLRETGPVEDLTAIFFLMAALIAVMVAVRNRRTSHKAWHAFVFAFSAGLFLLIALEEIAWGQHLLGFRPPDFIAGSNKQGEMTLHNLEAMHGRSDLMRLAFGAAGVIGMLFFRGPALERFAVPGHLASLMVTVLVMGILDEMEDHMSFPGSFGMAVHRSAEAVEMLCGLGALLYMWDKRRTISHPARAGR